MTDIEKIVTVMPMKVDLRDPENVRKLIVAVNDAEMQMDLLADVPPLELPDLRTTPMKREAAAD